MNQIKTFHEKLYAVKDKVVQDTYILKCCHPEKPKKTDKNKARNNTVSISYKIPNEKGTLIRVCKNAFLGITGVSRFRIERVVKNFMNNSEVPKERRGGDRIGDGNKEKKNEIKKFIESLSCVESHYCRSKSSERLYLPCELNFIKLYSMYENQVSSELCVKLSYFRRYVNTYYNIAFGSPQKDVCSTCLKVPELLKAAADQNEKQRIITEQRVHKLKAKAFYKLLQESGADIEVFSFDCQKNLALPKLPDQACYFSQQLNYYNFTVVNGRSRGKLDSSRVFSYLWLETDAPKDSNSIASAVYHCLKNFHFKGSIQTVRLFADGCGGQNKNGTMMAMLSSWLLNDAPKTLNSIEIVFPIVGHSFMPPDRVFGLVEKSLKKKSMIINPEEYDEVIGTWSTIRKIDEWCILDWRNESKSHLKPPGSWHLQFNKAKRFILTRSSKANILVRDEPNYVTDIGEGKGICKKGKKNSLLSPSTIPFGQLKGDKSSIDRLLCSHYGPSWKNNPELSLYERFFDSICPEDSSTNGNVSSAASEQCNNQEYIELEI
nr:unnamed protein product [Callosobruchus analis]